MAQHGASIAAAILEPTGSTYGQVPLRPAFVHLLRAETAKHGVVLVFDEVVTGFRVAKGGAQEVLGITPDLTTLAKILAGGLPGGAVVGRHRPAGTARPRARGRAGRREDPAPGHLQRQPALGRRRHRHAGDPARHRRHRPHARHGRRAARRDERRAGGAVDPLGGLRPAHRHPHLHQLEPPADHARAASTRWRWAMPTSRRRAGMRPSPSCCWRCARMAWISPPWPGGPVSAMHGPAEIEATAARLPRRAGRPARRGRGRLTMTQARALLLGERLDHRGLPREGAPLTDPVPLATPEGFTAFAFRWGAVVFIGATAAQEAAVIEMLKPRLTAPLRTPIEEAATHRDRCRAGRHRPRRRDPPARPVGAAARGGGGCAGEVGGAGASGSAAGRRARTGWSRWSPRSRPRGGSRRPRARCTGRSATRWPRAAAPPRASRPRTSRNCCGTTRRSNACMRAWRTSTS